MNQSKETPRQERSHDFERNTVTALRAVARRARAKEGESSDSDEKSGSIDVCKAMSRYNLADIPTEHFPKSDNLQRVLKKERRKFQHDRLPWVGGVLSKVFLPQRYATSGRMKEPQRGHE